jgi:hypothetical protein
MSLHIVDVDTIVRELEVRATIKRVAAFQLLASRMSTKVENSFRSRYRV